MPVATWSQLMLMIVPPRSWPRMTSPAAYEHAIVPLRSTASSVSSLRSHSHAAELAGEHVGAGVVDPHVDPAELVARLRDEPLARAARREVGLADEGAPAVRRDRVRDLARAARASRGA